METRWRVDGESRHRPRHSRSLSAGIHACYRAAYHPAMDARQTIAGMTESQRKLDGESTESHDIILVIPAIFRRESMHAIRPLLTWSWMPVRRLRA